MITIVKLINIVTIILHVTRVSEVQSQQISSIQYSIVSYSHHASLNISLDIFILHNCSFVPFDKHLLPPPLQPSTLCVYVFNLFVENLYCQLEHFVS